LGGEGSEGERAGGYGGRWRGYDNKWNNQRKLIIIITKEKEIHTIRTSKGIMNISPVSLLFCNSPCNQLRT